MEFLNQKILFIMLIPLIILIILILTNKDNIERVFSKETLEKLLTQNKSLSKGARNGLFFTALIFMTIALSRPVILKQEIKVEQTGASVVIALDISKSMSADDVYPNRLIVSKKKIDDFLTLNQNNKVALIAFANDSFMVSPLTSDIDSMRYLLKNLNTETISKGGTNILSALETTNRLLQDYKDKNLVIFSDGGDDSEFNKEIAYIKDNTIKVYISNIGSTSPVPIKTKDGYLKDSDGNIVVVKRNDEIKTLAKESGGVFTTYSLDNSDINAIYDDILNNAIKNKFDQENIKDYYELFYIPLSIGLFILFLALSSIPIKKLTPLLVLFFIYPNTSKALFLDFLDIQKATDYYNDGKYKEAVDEFSKVAKSNNKNEAHYNLANSHYKNKDYDKAISEYSKIVTNNKEDEAKKLYNLANSYVNKNDLNKAKELYEKSLSLKDDQDAKYNLEQVKKEIENQKKQNNENKQDKQNKDNNKKEDKQEQNKKEQKDNNKDKQEDKGKKEDKKQSDDKGQESQKDIKEAKQKEEMMSDKEEKNWLKKLDKKQNTYLYRIPTTPTKPNGKNW